MSLFQRLFTYIKNTFLCHSSSTLIANTLSAEVTDKGCVRQKNEDAVLSRPAAGLWAVADGMGGHLAGDYASQKIISALDSVSVENLRRSPAEAISGALKQAHQDINAYSIEEFAGKTVGSTVAVLFLENQRAHCFWMGDSRIYRYRGGALTPLTLDHSQAYALLKQGLLSLDEVDQHPSSHVLTRAMGSGEFDLDYQSFQLEKGDKFLLCSDGLYGELSHDEIISILKKESVDQAVQKLLQEALSKGARDNVSIILVYTDERSGGI